MRVFVTGATGFIGSAIVQELIGVGHEVTGLARSDKAAKLLLAAGAKVHRGSTDDLNSLRAGAAASDGVIHTAFIHDISHMSVSQRLQAIFGGSPSGIGMRFMGTMVNTDRRAIETMGEALSGSGRPFVVTSPTMLLPMGQLATEDLTPDPSSPGAGRIPSEKAALGMASRGVRATVIRLPPSVHGDGDYGFVPRLITAARKQKVSSYVGDGLNHWPAIHRLDAAHLFRLALENGIAGAAYHGVADEGVPMRDIASLIARKLDVPIASKSPKEAKKYFSWFAPFLGVDNLVSSTWTREQLGWQPKQVSLMEDLENGIYFKI